MLRSIFGVRTTEATAATPFLVWIFFSFLFFYSTSFSSSIYIYIVIYLTANHKESLKGDNLIWYKLKPFKSLDQAKITTTFNVLTSLKLSHRSMRSNQLEEIKWLPMNRNEESNLYTSISYLQFYKYYIPFALYMVLLILFGKNYEIFRFDSIFFSNFRHWTESSVWIHCRKLI